MKLSAFGYLVMFTLLGAPVSALYALYQAIKRAKFHVSDIGTLLVPPLIFLFVGRYFRPVLQTGWAMILWPIIIVVIAMYAFALKVAAIESRLSNHRAASIWLFIFISVLSLIVSFSVGPWYD